MKSIKLFLTAVGIYVLFSFAALLINNAALTIGMGNAASAQHSTPIAIGLLCVPPVLFAVISFAIWRHCRRQLPQHPLFPFLLYIIGFTCCFLPYWLIKMTL